MIIWTPENTPNGLFVPNKDRGTVALFYKAGAPSGMCPGQLMLIENWTGGTSRNLEHWGYGSRPIARRMQTDEEHNHAALCGRSLAQFYQDWPALIRDEEAIAADCPRIGTAFVRELKGLAKSKQYKLRKKEVLPEQVEPEMAELLELAPEEKQVVLETARAMGLSEKEQLTLFDV